MAAESSVERIAALEAENAALRRQLSGVHARTARQLRGIADALPVMISFLDRDERFVFANKAYEPWFGLPLDQIIGRRLSEVMPAEEYARRAPFVHRALAGETLRYEQDFRHPTGLRRTIIHNIPQVVEDHVVGVYAMVQDITDQWHALEAARESEIRFRRIADSAPVPIWVTASDRTREFVNEAYCAFLGLTFDEALRFDWRTILHVEDQERILAESVAGEASRQAFTLEARYRRGDGEWRWVRSISQPRFDGDGMPEGFIGVATDITAAKNAEREALDRARELQASVDRRTLERDRLWSLSTDAFAVCDLNGVWLSASPAWTTILGWSTSQLLGRTSAWMVHPDDRAATEQASKNLLAGLPQRAFSHRLRSADGGYRIISWSAVPEGDRVYCIGRDVTIERERADAMRQVEDALRQSQKMEALGQLTGGVAHDFNNLLTPILGTLDLLLARSPAGERQTRLLDGALQSALRAKTLVQRLLAYSRRQPLEAKPTALKPLLEGLGDLLRSTIGPTITIEADLADNLPPAMVDANQIEMAVLNLVVNARDAMPAGGRIQISLSAHDQTERGQDVSPGQYLMLAVADEGTGMDAETLARAAEPFFSTKASGAGTGLGLSMVHGLVGQLGGALRIHSEVGKGTRIEMLLPVSGQSPDTAVRGDGEVAAGDALTILLVDDEPLVRANTAAMLAELHHQVVDCGSGPEAIKLLEAGLSPDLLVTDQVMPQMSGVELVTAARQRRPTLPALIISGYPQGDEPRLVVGRLAKPFGVRDLAAAMARLPVPGVAGG
jgi:PAS domain S-box-containing protein